MYWGGWIREGSTEAPWDMTAASTFESHAGKGASIVHWSSPFATSTGSYYGFQTAQFDTVRSHGSIPLFSWANNPGVNGFSDAQVAAGSQDAYITAWAQAAKAWGHPFFLRFAWEMNGSWFPWGVGYNGTTTTDYVNMWRHVHDIFTRVGATNVSWVWCPNIDPYHQMASLSALYPGNSYVDWTCLDGYNGNAPWTSFANLFGSSYDAIVGIAPTKPMLVGETGSTESGGSKAQWISDMFAALPTRFPAIHAVVWFNKPETGPGGYTDWSIESSATGENAFAAGVANTKYTANQYANLATSPIPVP
jgi:beta-mannanase